MPCSSGSPGSPTPSLLYPRLISITRPTQPAGVGNLGHLGTSISEEVPIGAAAASIELASSGRNTAGARDVPADSPGPIKWTILISAADVARLPFIEERDMVKDDFGRRFQVAGYQPGPTGGRIDTVRIMV
jgi:hypothetical protein